jgi:hypothetical protein
MKVVAVNFGHMDFALWVWNGVHSALVRIKEDLLERKVAAPV